jgi:uncharacterized protein (TIGR02147 family)
MLLNLYQIWEYRLIIKDLVAQAKKEKAGWTQNKIASLAGIQSSFFTNVLKEKAHLSLDQLEALGAALKWDHPTTDYLGLLLEWERSANPKRRERLSARIKIIQKEQQRKTTPLKKEMVTHKIEEETKFFLSPKHFLVNSFLGIPKYAQSPSLIGKCLPITSGAIEGIIRDLIKIGAVARGAKGLEKIRRNFHLPSDSPLCEPHQALMQNYTDLHLRSLPETEKSSFRITFSSDPDTKKAIYLEFQKFLKAVEPLVKAAPAEELYGLAFDLFLWSHEGT